MAKAAETGTVHYKDRKGGDKWLQQDATSCKFNWGINVYRSEFKFPDPPPGEEWATIHGMSAEEFGIQDGYRPLLKSECGSYRHENDLEFFEGDEKWRTGRWVPHAPDKMRTKRPLPGAKEPVPENRPPAAAPVEAPAAVRPQFHNPQNLTQEQIGDGYRFLTMAEARCVPEGAEVCGSNTNFRRSGSVGRNAELGRTYRIAR